MKYIGWISFQNDFSDEIDKRGLVLPNASRAQDEIEIIKRSIFSKNVIPMVMICFSVKVHSYEKVQFYTHKHLCIQDKIRGGLPTV